MDGEDPLALTIWSFEGGYSIYLDAQMRQPFHFVDDDPTKII